MYIYILWSISQIIIYFRNWMVKFDWLCLPFHRAILSIAIYSTVTIIEKEPKINISEKA